MQKTPPELENIITLLEARWKLTSLEHWAMGWVSVIESKKQKIQLVSDRGYVDVYMFFAGQTHPVHIMPPEDQRASITPRQVCELIQKQEKANSESSTTRHG